MAHSPCSSSSLRAAFDVALIGAGLAGAATAHFCALRGLRVALIEAVSVGAGGATQHSRGIVRVYDPSQALMALGLKGAEFWRQFSFRDVNPFRQCGVFYIASRDNLQAITACLQSHNHASYPIRMLSSEETACIAPRLPSAVYENSVVLHEPLGGFVNPRLAAQLFAESARERAATIIEGSRVRHIEETRDFVNVHTDSGAICARSVVVAAGAFTKRLANNGSSFAPSLTDKPVSARGSSSESLAARVASTFVRSIPLGCIHDPEAQLPQCCVIDENSGGYLRPESDTLAFVGGARQSDAPDVDTLPALERDQCRHIGELADRLIGATGSQPIDMRAGYDAYTTDLLPIVQFVDDRSRVAVAFGFSGRGAKYIPALMSDFAGQIAERTGRLS